MLTPFVVSTHRCLSCGFVRVAWQDGTPRMHVRGLSTRNTGKLVRLVTGHPRTLSRGFVPCLALSHCLLALELIVCNHSRPQTSSPNLVSESKPHCQQNVSGSGTRACLKALSFSEVLTILKELRYTGSPAGV